MRILFFGTAEFAIPSLIALRQAGKHDVLAVVTQPDKAQGRGQHVSVSPVKRMALQIGLPVVQPKRVRSDSFVQAARELAPDLIVVAAFGQIIPQSLLDLPPFGPINVHGSLLPAYRGAAPIQHAILNGESETGVTTMWMDASLDTGDMLLKRELAIEPDDTTGTLTPKLAEIGAELLIETIDRLAEADCPRTPQDNAQATYAPAISPVDGLLRWEETADRCRNRVRALSPKPGAFSHWKDRRIKLWETLSSDGGGAPGEVLSVDKEGVVVAAGQGALLLREVQAENSRRMSAAEWARGARLAVGERFG
jgi:methionyl-tRNA formyltransferase